MREALFLLGPTGSGKTPLGEALEAAAFEGRPCHHLDFGALLRRVAAGEIRVSRAYRRVVQDALERGRLLEDDEWVVADALIDEFLDVREIGPGDQIVLNGIPRHVGQADDIDRVFAVRTLIRLEAPAAVLLRRIASDAAGDRGGRGDDDAAAVKARLLRFEARTRPLLTHYAEQGARVLTIPVGEYATGADLLDLLHP